MEINVNGNKIEIEPQPGEMLSSLLRKRLGLTGTKIGCDELECGSCTVLVDGQPVLSCNYPAARAAGKQVITIEGLADLYKPPSPGNSHSLPTSGSLYPIWSSTMRLLYPRTVDDHLCFIAAQSNAQRG